MPYYGATIKFEAQYTNNLGPNATEDKFHGIYNGILTHWFPTSRGYIIDSQVLEPGGKPEYIVVRHAEGSRNPVLIVELQRPSKRTEGGKKNVVDQLTDYIEGRLDLTSYNTIYGLGGIGLRWMMCKMEKSGDHKPTVVLDWQDNIASDASFAEFENIANLIYNLKIAREHSVTVRTFQILI